MPPAPPVTPAVPQQTLRLTESDKLQVQIQAYLDNVFDVGAMLEDSETKTAVLEHMEELQEHVSQVGRGCVGRAADASPEGGMRTGLSGGASSPIVDREAAGCGERLHGQDSGAGEAAEPGAAGAGGAAGEPGVPRCWAEGPGSEGCSGTPVTARGLSPLQEQLSLPRPPSPPSPQPQECYRLALEKRLVELEEKGLVQILRGPDGDVAIEIVPVVIETPSAPVVSGEATTTTDTTATCTGIVGARGCPLSRRGCLAPGRGGSESLGTAAEAGVWGCARELRVMR